MEKFRKVIALRLKLLCAVSGISALIIIIIMVLGSQGIIGISNMGKRNFVQGFHVGLFTALQAIILLQIKNLWRGLKNTEMLKVLYIKEHDERKRMIHQKIGSLAFNIIMIGITMAAVVSGFYNTVIFFTLLATLIFIVGVKASLKLYCSKKY